MNIIQLFAALGGASPNVQYLRPNADYAPAGIWLPYGDTETWECTDDVTPDEDTTYAGNLTNGSWLWNYLSAPVAPPRASQLHRLFVRQRVIGSASATHWDFRLFQGSNPSAIAIFDDNPETPSAWTTYQFDLSPAQIAAITDYSTLRLGYERLAAIPSVDWDVRITQWYMQIGGS